MSYSDQKGKYDGLPASSGPSVIDLQYLRKQAVQPVIDEDHAVEILIDQIRGTPCGFLFKRPLGADFATARDHAMNCLELGNPPLPRRVRNWINDFLKCTDCILLVYLQNVIGKKVPRNGKWPKERDLYDMYESLPDESLKRVGVVHNAIYQTRSEYFEHYLKHDPTTGRINIRRSGDAFVANKYEFVRSYFSESMGTMVSVYRTRFPDCCIVA